MSSDKKFVVGDKWKDREGNEYEILQISQTNNVYPIAAKLVKQVDLEAVDNTGIIELFTEGGKYYHDSVKIIDDIEPDGMDLVERVCAE